MPSKSNKNRLDSDKSNIMIEPFFILLMLIKKKCAIGGQRKGGRGGGEYREKKC